MQTQLPCRLCSDVANTMTRAADVTAACESVLATLFSTLLTESAIFQWRNGVCTRVAGTVNTSVQQKWAAHLATLPANASIGAIPGQGEGESVATFVPIGTVGERRMFLVIDADLTASSELLAACASIIAFGLEAVHQREQLRANSALLRSTYRLLLAVSRARGSDGVARAIATETGRLLRADRVSLAKYQPETNRLVLAAGRGFSIDGLPPVEPGEWVLGHVHESGKAVVVNNTAELPALAPHRGRYSSRAYAVVPLVHNRRKVGVLSVTDQRDRLPFTQAQRFALRALSPFMGTVIAAEERGEQIEHLRYAATVDAVTGLHNRTYLERRLYEEVERSQRDKRPLSVLMVDIDNLKPINDAHGHSAGDAVLKHVGQVLRSAVRVFDVCARYGGDEFVVVMPNSDTAMAYACAERIRARVTQALDTTTPAVTLSIGVASAAADDTPADLTARADRALYEAKAHGKNEVRIAGLPPEVMRHGATSPGQSISELPYMLIADPSEARSATYREHAERARLGLLVARDGGQALRVMQQFGPPVMLVVDMASRAMGGVALLEWLHQKRAPTFVMAFSSSVTLKRYVSTTSAASQTVVLRPDASPSLVRSTLTTAVARPTGATPTGGAILRAPDPADLRSCVASLAARARRIFDVSGVAVYLKDAQGNGVRCSVSWASDELPSHIEERLARVATEVIATGEPVALGRVGASPVRSVEVAADSPSIFATPLRLRSQVVGAICAFAEQPLALTEEAIYMFREIGNAAIPPEVEAAPVPAPSENPQANAGFSERRPAGGPEWQPTLLERQRGEFEVARELARSRREERQLSIVLFDISGLSQGEDHATVDAATIASIADTLIRVIRPSDLPIQWSSKELLLVLPGLTGDDARAVAERVRAAMQAASRHRLAVSGGVAELERNEQFPDVVERARERVMLALSRGHNRVS